MHMILHINLSVLSEGFFFLKFSAYLHILRFYNCIRLSHLSLVSFPALKNKGKGNPPPSWCC